MLLEGLYKECSTYVEYYDLKIVMCVNVMALRFVILSYFQRS
jgi:hypothetical protein